MAGQQVSRRPSFSAEQRRHVLLADEGRPRNAFSVASHGFLTRDGIDPAQLRQLAHEELRRYDTVEVRDGRVQAVHREGDLFVSGLADGSEERSRRILLATGLTDEVPPIDGIEPLWGKSVFKCRYCDGWEVRDQPLAVLGGAADPVRGTTLALELTALTSDVVWCADGPVSLDDGSRARLAAAGVQLREEPIHHLEGREGQLERVTFTGGEPLSRRAAFVLQNWHQQTDLAQQLGCTVLDDGLIEVDDFQRTNVPAVFAAGDIARRATFPIPAAYVVMAAATGATAAVAIDTGLLREQLGAGGPRPRAARQGAS